MQDLHLCINISNQARHPNRNSQAPTAFQAGKLLFGEPTALVNLACLRKFGLVTTNLRFAWYRFRCVCEVALRVATDGRATWRLAGLILCIRVQLFMDLGRANIHTHTVQLELKRPEKLADLAQWRAVAAVVWLRQSTANLSNQARLSSLRISKYVTSQFVTIEMSLFRKRLHRFGQPTDGNPNESSLLPDRRRSFAADQQWNRAWWRTLRANNLARSRKPISAKRLISLATTTTTTTNCLPVRFDRLQTKAIAAKQAAARFNGLRDILGNPTCRIPHKLAELVKAHEEPSSFIYHNRRPQIWCEPWSGLTRTHLAHLAGRLSKLPAFGLGFRWFASAGRKSHLRYLWLGRRSFFTPIQEKWLMMMAQCIRS